MATREPSVELFYDPEDLDPEASRLRIGKSNGRWELRDDGGALLSSHAILPEALDAALERSEVCFSEIVVRGSSGGIEWAVSQNPEMVELARLLNDTAPLRREAAA
ncbi:MAG TPA: hypothetical protein VFR37_25060 [Longimicrobium sp.]|nr:hypothetical protein [Longimicrobium sp.]